MAFDTIRFILEVCFVLDNDRLHENCFASMLLPYSFSMSFVIPSVLSDLSKYDITVFLYLLSTFFTMPSIYLPLTSPTIMSKPGCVYPLARPFFTPFTPLSFNLSSLVHGWDKYMTSKQDSASPSYTFKQLHIALLPSCLKPFQNIFQWIGEDCISGLRQSNVLIRGVSVSSSYLTTCVHVAFVWIYLQVGLEFSFLLSLPVSVQHLSSQFNAMTMVSSCGGIKIMINNFSG